MEDGKTALMQQFVGRSGLVAHLGSNDSREWQNA